MTAFHKIRMAGLRFPGKIGFEVHFLKKIKKNIFLREKNSTTAIIRMLMAELQITWKNIFEDHF